MNKIKAEIVVMSHLSDAQEEISFGFAAGGINYRLNFVKFIILKCNGDLTQEIEPIKLWDEYRKDK